MSVSFDNIPGSGLIAPLFAFEVTSGGEYESERRVVLGGHTTSGATLAEGEMQICTSLEDATLLAGDGSMLREMYRVFAQNAPTMQVWLSPIAESGAKGTWTLTVGSPPAAGGTGVVEIGGEAVEVSIGAGDTATTVATALAAAINGYYDKLTGAQLQVTATSAAAVVTATARHAGAVFADYDITVPTTTDGNAFTGVLTVAAGTAPTGTPNLTNFLAAIGDDEASFIVTPFSDATNLGRADTALDDVSGRWAYSRQSYGHYWTTVKGTTGEMTTIGLGRNNRHETIVPRYAGTPEPAWVWIAGIVACVAPWLADDTNGNVSRNQTGKVVSGISPPRSRTNWPAYATRNALLAVGISTWKVNSSGEVVIDKLITTYQKNSADQPDVTFRDVQAMYQLMAGLGIIRADLSYEHGQKALADSNPSNLGSISTAKDIKATLVHSYQKCADRGIFENTAGFAERLIVERDVGNSNRVNVLAPIDRVNALDVLAGNAKLYGQYAA